MAELYRLNKEPEKEIEYLNKALALVKNNGERDILRVKLEKSSIEK